MYKATQVIEQFWLIFTIGSFLYAWYVILFVSGWSTGYQYFFVPAISFFWWLFRRSLRKRLEKNMNSDNQPK
jgi:Flp pilus assembly protein TadB